jgi:TonB-dependent receptor
MTRILILPFIFTLFAATVYSQKGTISGKVIEKATGMAVIGGSVRADCGTIKTGAVSDLDGNFLIQAMPGLYRVSITYPSFKTEQVDITVKSGEVQYLNFALEEATSSLSEVVITATVEKSSSVALLSARKNAAQVSDGVSADIIRRTPDRTTSDVLKRVTGASIQDNKFAVVRGMNDRYNAGYLDGSMLPSTESDRKAFAFDVVPANLIDNLQIIKAGTPDMLGDFGGGIIRINTKAVPERFVQTISIGGQMHSLTTNKKFTQCARYNGEALNVVSSKRDLPAFGDTDLKPASTFANSEEKIRFADITKRFNNDWSNESITAVPNLRFAYSLGLPIQISEDKKMGVLVALNYANTRRTSAGLVNSYDGVGQTTRFNDQIFLNNISSGGLVNLNYITSKTQINFRNLINFNTDNNSLVREGMANIQDALEARSMANLINYNRLYNGVVSLKQIVGENLFSVQTSVNYGSVRRRIPDYRIANYIRTPDFPDYSIAIGEFFNTSTGRFSSDLNESLKGANVELAKHLNTKSVKTEVKLGGMIQTRDRSFEGRSFVYGGQQPATLTYNPAEDLAEANIGATGLYLVDKTNLDLNYYNGAQKLNVGYLMADQNIGKLRAVYGVRYEDVAIDLRNEKLDTDLASIKEDIWLPSANLSYSLSEKTNLRTAYFKSVNRPEFRELAPFAFYVFDRNAEIRGNTALQIATLNNFDLRLEYFPTGNQVLSIGGFYKTIEKPIEFSLDIAQATTTFTYENEQSAKIYGIELEARKNLSFISNTPTFSNIVVFSNLALIRSELTFREGSASLQGRPLQGQSPYVLNAGVQYENQENGWSGSLVFNKIGRRLAYVGVDASTGDSREDIYEAPRSVLDFQIGKNIGKFNLKLTLGDLLKQNLTYYQDSNKDKKYEEGVDRLNFQFTNGFSASLTAGYSF